MEQVQVGQAECDYHQVGKDRPAGGYEPEGIPPLPVDGQADDLPYDEAEADYGYRVQERQAVERGGPSSATSIPPTAPAMMAAAMARAM